MKGVYPAGGRNGGGGRDDQAGLMDEIPDACFALHVEMGSREDSRGSRYLTAYSDSYKITVHGKAAHSSTPEEGVDAVYIAASIVTALTESFPEIFLRWTGRP